MTSRFLPVKKLLITKAASKKLGCLSLEYFHDIPLLVGKVKSLLLKRDTTWG
jgi:hypothetical protein